MTDSKLGLWDFVAVGCYFAAVIAAGIFAMCRSNRSTVNGYFLAGRFMTWLPVGASLFASNIGSEHFIGLAGSGAASGVAVGAFELNACILLQLLGWVFLPVYIASGVCTLPEYMKKRFGGRRIRIYLASLSLILYIFTKVSVNLYSGALFIQQALHWNIYISVLLLLTATAITTVTGGLAAVIYTDTLQMFVMVAGAGVLTVISFLHVGGYEQLYHRYMHAIPNTTLANVNETCGYPREDAWVMLRDAFSSDMPWPAFLLGQTPASIWYWCTDQMMVQRTLAARSLSHAQGGTVFAGYLKLLPIFLLVLPGMISRVLFTDEVACADPDVCFAVCQNRYGCSNIAYPKLVLELMPAGLKGIMLSVMLAALMSDLTSIFNSASTLFTIDIYRYFRVKACNRELMIVGRVFVCVMIGIGIIWIPVIQGMQGAQLYLYIQAVSAYLAPPIACVYLMAVLWRRGNEQGAFWGLMVGFVIGVVRMTLDFIYTEPGCGEEDRRPLLIARIHYMYFAMILFAVTGLTMVLVSCCSKPPEPSKIIRTTFWTRHDRSIRDDDNAIYAPIPNDVRATEDYQETLINGHAGRGKYLEMTMIVNAAATAMSNGNSKHPDDADMEKTVGNGTENGGACLLQKNGRCGDGDTLLENGEQLNQKQRDSVVFTVACNGKHASDAAGARQDTIAAPKRCSLRHFVDWFCGLDASTAPQDASAQKMATRLRDLQALKQNPRSRALLYTALAMLITLNLFVYVFFSTGSDFGLFRNSSDSWKHLLYENVSSSTGPPADFFRSAAVRQNATDFSLST